MTRLCLCSGISTDEDLQPTSLKTQRERLERYCEAMEPPPDRPHLPDSGGGGSRNTF